MLYSIGKDSSVMLRLAQKAFYPGAIPFPLLHVDTGFKFAEMLSFRDEMARSVGAELLVWRNEEAIAAGANPIALDTKRCCQLLKTQGLLDGLRHYNFDAAFGGARRDEEKSRAKERIYSFRRRRPVGPEESAPGVMEPLQRARSPRRKHSRLSALQLDRDGRLAIHSRGKDSGCRSLLCQAAPDVC
jgi:3'-phosphoadenosine 5'-phosphosulfate sulfotransferase (PAPS reductase)/FAD synthetase